jgi:hypothetical protein
MALRNLGFLRSGMPTTKNERSEYDEDQLISTLKVDEIPDHLKEIVQKAADTFNNIIIAEEHHEQMYLELAENTIKQRCFEKEEVQTWRCLSCGYLHTGKKAPDNALHVLNRLVILNCFIKTGSRSKNKTGLSLDNVQTCFVLLF